MNAAVAGSAPAVLADAAADAAADSAHEKRIQPTPKLMQMRAGAGHRRRPSTQNNIVRHLFHRRTAAQACHNLGNQTAAFPFFFQRESPRLDAQRSFQNTNDV